MGSHEPLFLRDLNDSIHRGTRTSEIGATAGRGSGSGRGLRARVDLRSGRSEPGSGLLRKIRIRSWQESEALNNAAMAAIINPTSNPVPPGGQQRGGQTEKETPDRMRCGGERRFRQECQTPAAPTLACSLDAADLPRAAPLACSCARAAGSRAQEQASGAARDADAVTGIAPNGCQVSQRTRTRKSLLVVLDFSFPKGKSLRCSKVPDLIGLDESTRLRHTSQKVGYKLAYCKGDWLGVLRTRKNSLDLSWRCLDGTPNVFVPHCPGTAPTVPAKRGSPHFRSRAELFSETRRDIAPEQSEGSEPTPTATAAGD